MLNGEFGSGITDAAFRRPSGPVSARSVAAATSPCPCRGGHVPGTRWKSGNKAGGEASLGHN